MECMLPDSTTAQNCTVMYKCITLDEQQSMIFKNKLKAVIMLNKVTAYNRNNRLEKIENGE
jgi:hypothetical protein